MEILKIKNFKFCVVISISAFCIFNLLGCVTIKKVGCNVREAAKGIIGISTKQIEEARKDAAVKTFDYDYASCYKNVKEILSRIGAYTYCDDKNKKFIAFYVSAEDTTPVGIFFKEIDASKTQLEVASPSTSAKETIANNVFSALEKRKEKELNEKK